MTHSGALWFYSCVSDKHDKLRTLKVSRENSKGIDRISKKFPLKPSFAKLCNAAIEKGIPILERSAK